MEPWSGYFSYQVRKLWYSFGKMREIPTRRVSCSYFIRYLREGKNLYSDKESFNHFFWFYNRGVILLYAEVCRESEMCSDDIKH